MKDNIYDQFIQLNQLYKIRSIKVKSCKYLLEQIKLSDISGTNYQISISLAQQLISYRFNSKMVYKLAFSVLNNKKAKIPLPRALLRNFSLESFKISRLSIVANIFQDFLLIFRSSILLATNIFLSHSKQFGDLIKEKKREGYTVVMLNPSFPKGNIFSEDTEFNFINWHRKRLPNKVCYIHFNKKFKNTEIIYKNKQTSIIYISRFNLNIKLNLKLRLFKNCIVTVIKSGRRIPGKFFSILKLIDQIVLAEQIKLTENDRLPEIIIFSDNHGVLQPYWTYALQEKKVKVQYYFFSSYDSPSVIEGEDPRVDFWQLNSWPEIYCVDSYQARFINSHKISKNQQIKVAGFPDFTDYPIQLDFQDSRFKMLVFDYEPRIGHFGYSSINDCGYHTFASNQLFIRLLYELAKNMNLLMIHKPKRLHSDRHRDGQYSEFIKSLDLNFYRKIDPRVSPKKIMNFADIVISKPITSTAFIAKEAFKESVFFDPLGKVSKDDPALRNLQIFSTIEELSQYIKTQNFSKENGR